MGQRVKIDILEPRWPASLANRVSEPQVDDRHTLSQKITDQWRNSPTSWPLYTHTDIHMFLHRHVHSCMLTRAYTFIHTYTATIHVHVFTQTHTHNNIVGQRSAKWTAGLGLSKKMICFERAVRIS